MAKKATGKAKAAVRPGGKKTPGWTANARRAAARKRAPTKGKKPREAKRRPRQQPLIEDVRIKALDDICASISETREEINELKQTEAGQEKNALALMRKHDKTSWRHSGVELIRVPGEERLRVRTTKAAATAEVSDAGDGEVTDDPGSPDPVFEASGGKVSEQPTAEEETAGSFL
jgi:hypothetical protein